MSTEIDNDILNLFFDFGKQLIPVSKTEPHASKRPLHKDWQNKKYTKAEILKYVIQGYNLGWQLSDTDLVIDVDPRNDKDGAGYARLKKDWHIQNLEVELPTVITGSGGLHFYLKKPSHLKVKNSIAEYGKGIEFKSKGRQVIIPGSRHPSGNFYKFEQFSEYESIAPNVPNWLLEKIKYSPTTTDQPQSTEPLLTPQDLAELLVQLPITDFADNDAWYPILAASHSATQGTGFAEFLAWSLSDPVYAEHEPIIHARWQSLDSTKQNGISANTLFREVAIRGGNLPQDKIAMRDFDILQPIKNSESQTTKLRIADRDFLIAEKVIDNCFAGGKHILKTPSRQFYIYTGKYWRRENRREIEDNQINEYSKRYLRTLEIKCKPALNSVVTQVNEAFRRDVCNERDLFNPEQGNLPIINTQNYEIHLYNSGKYKLQSHDPESYLTSCLPFDYVKDAKCPVFDKTLKEIFANHHDTSDIIRHLLEVFAYTLQPHKNIAAWILFKGGGANGKTLLLNLLQSFLGDAIISKPLKSLNVGLNNHAFAGLPGKLAVIDDDLTARTILPDSTLKLVSENKLLEANPKGQPAFRFLNQAIIYLSSNHWPKVVDLSEGLRRRALIFNFTRTFQVVDQDTDRLAELQIERPGILNRLLSAYQRLRERGNFKIPKSCQRAFDMWFREANQATQFIYECFVSDNPHDKISLDEIFGIYCDWTGREGVKQLYSRNGIARELVALRYERYRGNNNVIYFRKLKLKKEIIGRDFL